MKNKQINHGQGLIEYIGYFNNDKIFYHRTKLNGKYHGEYRVYNLEGKMKYYDCYYKNGWREGECIKYKYEK